MTLQGKKLSERFSKRMSQIEAILSENSVVFPNIQRRFLGNNNNTSNIFCSN